MKHVVWKMYSDYEKEEKWLNEMSAKGLALTRYTWCRYVFEETPANRYIYRIELLGNVPAHPESSAYLRFLEESGVECVTSYMRWVYLRKKASEGPFDIYTDIESKLRHYKRINALWSTLMFAEFAIGCSNLTLGIMRLNEGDTIGNFSFVMGSFLILAGLLFFKLGVPIRKKIRKLKREKTVRE